jgi:hypothetical protein
MTAPTDFSKPTLGVDSHYVGVVCVLGDYLAQGRYADLDVHQIIHPVRTYALFR